MNREERRWGYNTSMALFTLSGRFEAAVAVEAYRLVAAGSDKLVLSLPIEWRTDMVKI